MFSDGIWKSPLTPFARPPFLVKVVVSWTESGTSAKLRRSARFQSNTNIVQNLVLFCEKEKQHIIPDETNTQAIESDFSFTCHKKKKN